MLWFLGLNSLGLILDIVGVVLLFFFGLPVEDVSKFGGQQLLWPAGEEQERLNQERYRRRQLLSRMALVCLVSGFTLQLLSSLFHILCTDILGFSGNLIMGVRRYC